MYIVTSNGQFLNMNKGESWELDIKKASFFPDDTLSQLIEMADNSKKYKIEIRTLDGGIVYQNYLDSNIVLS